MSTKRDLVEAHGFNRRRLVSAFVSGAPGGREVEPTRHGRTVVGGVVLAGLVLAGAAVSGFLQRPPPQNWDQQGLVIGADSGSRFFAQGGVLFPVINTTSARLLIPDGVEPVTVSDELIASRDLGSTVGIAGAPEVLPGPDQLVERGWTACTDASGGVQLTLPGSADAASRPAADEAIVVSVDDELVLVSGGYRHAVPSGDTGALVLRNLGLDGIEPVAVTGLWLNLFPLGGPLSPVPDVDGLGDQVSTSVPGLGQAGVPVEVDGATYVLDADGELQRTTPFAHQVFTAQAPAVSLTAAQAQAIPSDASGEPFPADWPEAAITPYSDPGSPCVRLDTAQGQAPEIRLATAGADAARAQPGAIGRNVALGGGAVIRATTGNVVNSGSVYLVDGAGSAFAVGASSDGSGLSSLGYDGYQPRPVPQPWLALFNPGPRLDVQSAARPPAQAVVAADDVEGGQP